MAEGLFLNVTNEKAGKAGPHFGAHSHPTTLLEVIAVEGEGVEGQDKFCQTEDGGDVELKGASLEEVFYGQKTILVRDVGV